MVGGLSEGSQAVQYLVSFGWPVILTLIGLIMLAGAIRSSSSEA